MTRVVVSLHDVAPATAEKSRRWLELLEARSLRVSLLVVPGPWQGTELASSASFLSWLRRAEENGHEVVLHGWAHQREVEPRGVRGHVGALLGRGCEEFWDLPYTTAAERIARGIAALGNEGFFPAGFVAPGWLMSRGTLHALRATNLRYTLTHTRLVDLASNESRRVLTTSQRPNDRLGSLFALGTAGLAAFVTTRRRPLRIAVHPDDLVEPALRRANLNLCDAALGHGYSTVTYRDLHHLVFPQRITN